MTDDTEGLLIAHSCMLQALIARLIENETITPDDVAAFVGEAEGFLAGLSPSLMTAGARDYAKRVLQQSGRILPPES